MELTRSRDIFRSHPILTDLHSLTFQIWKKSRDKMNQFAAIFLIKYQIFCNIVKLLFFFPKISTKLTICQGHKITYKWQFTNIAKLAIYNIFFAMLSNRHFFLKLLVYSHFTEIGKFENVFNYSQILNIHISPLLPNKDNHSNIVPIVFKLPNWYFS